MERATLAVATYVASVNFEKCIDYEDISEGFSNKCLCCDSTMKTNE